MQRSFSLFVALRLIRPKNSSGYLSFISWASMLGLIVGVTALIILSSIMNGFEQTLSSRILGMVAHTSLQSHQPIDDWKKTGSELQANNDNIVGFAPFVLSRGMTSINGNVHGTIINGIDPKEQAKVSIIGDIMVAGSLDTLESGGHNIILGKTLVDNNDLKIGDSVSLFIAKPSNSASGIEPVFQTFTLTGVFNATEKVNEWMSYVAMDDASSLLGVKAGVRGIRFKLADVMKSEQTVKQIESAIKKTDSESSYWYYQWKQTHGSIYETIRMQKTMINLLLFLIIVVAAFNIISTLMMLVMEKKADIAILKTCGATPKRISHIFLYQGIVIGVFGTGVGLLVGISITLVLGDLSYWVDSTFNLRLFDNYYIDSIPTQIRLADILAISGATIFISILATLYPAKKAAKIEPASALRYE